MSAIAKGDMVQMVWGCCESTRRFIGTTFTVVDLRNVPAADCIWCGYKYAGLHAFADKKPERDAAEGECVFPLPWLIKVEPPAREETETYEREVVA